MNTEQEVLTIQEVARLTKTTTRTLRWYDELDLVVPDRDPVSQYRRYHRGHLKTLQQVMFYRELSFSLEHIKRILKDPHYNRQKAFERQLVLLREKQRKMDELVHTLELALQEERGAYTMKHEERFKGFDFSHNPYEDEARKTWGDETVKQSKDKLEDLGEEARKGMGQSMDAIFGELAQLRNTDPASDAAQKAIRVWYDFLNTIGTYTPQMFANLGRMYVDDPRFTKNIDRFGEGLAHFMMEAMVAFERQSR